MSRAAAGCCACSARSASSATGRRPARAPGRSGLALEELGTTFVKLGQLLSSRPDLLPDVYIEELGELVDDVPPFPFAEARRIIDEDIGLDVFARLDEEPLACASIAQIHGALLRTGPRRRRQGAAAGDRGAGRARPRAAALADLLRRRAAPRRPGSLQLQALADELEAHLTAELDFVEEAHGSELIAQARRRARAPGRAGRDPSVRDRARSRPGADRRREGRPTGTASTASARRARARALPRLRRSRSPCTASTTPIRTAATSCSPPTGGSCCSTSACSAGSTTTRGGRSACSCSRSRRTAPTTSPT